MTLVQIWLNGEPREIADNAPLAELMAPRGAAACGVAVALNERVIHRREWPRTLLQAGDRVSVFALVCGG